MPTRKEEEKQVNNTRVQNPNKGDTTEIFGVCLRASACVREGELFGEMLEEWTWPCTVM